MQKDIYCSGVVKNIALLSTKGKAGYVQRIFK